MAENWSWLLREGMSAGDNGRNKRGTGRICWDIEVWASEDLGISISYVLRAYTP